MTVTQMLYFQSICQYESVTKAARHLKISQPALSNAIKDLENEFGLNLFHRRNKRFVLTKEGEYFLSKVTPLLDEHKDILANMKSFSVMRNNIKLGVQAFSSTLIVPHLLTDFYEKYPEIKFDMQDLPSHLITQNVANGSLDAGLIHLNGVDTRSFDAIELYTTPFYFCVRSDSKFADRTEMDITEIGDYPLVLPANAQYSPTGLLSSFKKAGVTPNVLFYTSQYSALAEYIHAGGVGAFLCEEIIESYDNIVKIKVDAVEPRVLGLITKKSQHVHADTAKFIEFVREWVFEHPVVGGLQK